MRKLTTQREGNPFCHSDSNKRYYTYDYWLRETFGGKCAKIPLDAGFTCPNIDGRCGRGGCIYCSGRGSGDFAESPILPIAEQYRIVREKLSSKWTTERCIPYFQAHTNTYAPLSVLREKYEEALLLPGVVGMNIGTRADCIDEEIASLIASYKDKYEVWVELGLQTANDDTARKINRGYTRDVFDRAMRILSDKKIKTVVHLMLGLPGEDINDNIKSAEYVASLTPFGVKVHSLYVMRDTKLEKIYNEKGYTPPTLSEYSDAAAEVLARIPADTVVHRITGDCPRDMLVAPDWNRDKNEIIASVNQAMIRKEYRQGILFNK